jgi:hypothetical protein
VKYDQNRGGFTKNVESVELVSDCIHFAAFVVDWTL